MKNNNTLNKIQSELQKGIGLKKCQKCGCMKDALEQFKSNPEFEQAANFSDKIPHWLHQMLPIEYSCLGCKHCYAAVATNLYHKEFPDSESLQPASCGFEANVKSWPPVPGEYFVLPSDEPCQVAVSTLSSVDLAEKVANINPDALCIVGKTETENIGIDKLVKNTISNPEISTLILAGKETRGHYPGKTLLALMKNGVDKKNQVIGSPGKRPILQNVNKANINLFRKKIDIIDMIGCEDAEKIISRVNKVSKSSHQSCGCITCEEGNETDKTFASSPVQACSPPSEKIKLDKSGYFVIIPKKREQKILVEHYSYSNKLLRTIEGNNARDIYFTIIENKWITLLSHAAYIGKELAKAELSMDLGFKYVQDGA